MKTPIGISTARVNGWGSNMIRKTGEKFVVMSKGGKRLSKPMSKEAAEKRLRQIEYFKHKKD